MTGLVVLAIVVIALLLTWLRWEHRMIDQRAEQTGRRDKELP